MSPSGKPDKTRRRLLQSAVAAAVAAPMLNFGRYQVFAADTTEYSARAIELVERSLVIDMLGVLKLDFTPEAYALPASEEEAVMFRGSGITAFHNAIGLGGPTAYEDALAFLAAWQGYAGRNAHIYSLVGQRGGSRARQGRRQDRGDHGHTECRSLPQPRRREVVLPAWPALFATHLQQPELHRHRQYRSHRRRRSAISASRSSRR